MNTLLVNMYMYGCQEAGRKGSTLTIFLCCCFTANFGPWNLGPQHGFARTSQWTVSQQPKVWTFFYVLAVKAGK